MSEPKIENVTTEEAFLVFGLALVLAGTVAATVATMGTNRWVAVGLFGIGIGSLMQTIPLALKSRRIIRATVLEIADAKRPLDVAKRVEPHL